MTKPLAKPEPVPKQLCCSVCGMPWQPHKQRPGRTKSGAAVNVASPTLEDCVRVLKAELARRPSYAIPITSSAAQARFLAQSRVPFSEPTQ
jgi:hypothetical protein